MEHSFVSHVVFSPCVQKRRIHGVAVGKRIIPRKTVGSRTVILRSLSQVYTDMKPFERCEMSIDSLRCAEVGLVVVRVLQPFAPVVVAFTN